MTAEARAAQELPIPGPRAAAGRPGTAPADPASLEPTSLRAVVVARPGAANAFVLSHAARACRVQRVLTDVPPPRPPRTLRAELRRWTSAPLATLAKPLRHKVLSRLDSRLEAGVSLHLGGVHPAVFSTVERMTPAALNGDDGARLLRDAAPDLLILSGAPLLKPHIYGIPRLGTVNLHWGIAPAYRGQQSIFTALRRHDYGAIGVTLHYVDQGVDTGPVLAQGWPALDPSDTLATITAKTARLAATMLSDFVSALSTGAVDGQRLSGPGVNVRSRDRRVRHHVGYALARRVLRRRPPTSEGRIVRYW
jgi:folate-dependent phosphoribosylglycinamide formyltransferase PurN